VNIANGCIIGPIYGRALLHEVEHDFLVVLDPPRLVISFHGEEWTHHVLVDNFPREFRKVIYHSDVLSDMTHASMH
jgi:hypothetical protein